MDHREDIHKLSLVFVNSLHLDIVHGINWHIVSSFGFDPCGQSSLVLYLNLNELVLELLVSCIWHQVPQVVKGGDPLIDTTKGLTDEIRESRVAAVNPSSWSNSISLVLKFTWIEGIKFTENGVLKELRMEGGNTVNSV